MCLPQQPTDGDSATQTCALVDWLFTIVFFGKLDAVISGRKIKTWRWTSVRSAGACRIDHIVCVLSSRICLCLKLFVYERNSFQLQMSFLTFSLSFETFLVPVFDFFFVLLPASNDEDRDRDFF